MTMKKSGFTLVEIMIVVLIIGLLAAIAVPNFVKARKSAQRNACIDNLRQIEGAIEQVRMNGETPSTANVYGAENFIKTKPQCPSTKADYTIPTDDSRPVCPNPSVNGTDETDLHKLPDAEVAGT